MAMNTTTTTTTTTEMEVQMMMHIKLYICNKKGATQEMRRFGVPLETRLDEVRQVIQGMVNNNNNNNKFRDHPLMYRDSDGDLVTLGSQVEWEECQRVGGRYCDPCAPLRLYAATHKRKAAAAGTVPQTKTTTPTPIVVEGEYFYQSDCKPQEHSVSRLDELRKAVESVVERYQNQEEEGGQIPEFLQCALRRLGDDQIDVDLSAMAQALSDQGLREMTAGDNKEALKHLLDSYVIRPTSTKRYNIGCCYALEGDTDLALEALRSAVEMGYNNVEHMVMDEDLVSLHGNPQFVELLHRMADQQEGHDQDKDQDQAGPVPASSSSSSSSSSPPSSSVVVVTTTPPTATTTTTNDDDDDDAPAIVPAAEEEEEPPVRAPVVVPEDAVLTEDLEATRPMTPVVVEGPLKVLTEMGFSIEEAHRALDQAEGDQRAAVEILLGM